MTSPRIPEAEIYAHMARHSFDYLTARRSLQSLYWAREKTGVKA